MSRSAAELIYDKLGGISCLFKPADMQLTHFLSIVQERLATGRLLIIEENYRSESKWFSDESNSISASNATC